MAHKDFTVPGFVKEAEKQGCVCDFKHGAHVLYRQNNETVRVVIPRGRELSASLCRQYGRVLSLSGYDDDPPADWEPSDDEQT